VGVAAAVAAALLAAKGGSIAPGAVGLAGIAGVAIGASFVIFDFGEGSAPLWMLFGARAAGGAILGTLWIAKEGPSPLRFGRLLVCAGLLDALANGLLILSIGLIPVGLAASVAAVTPPIVTMLLARIVIQEKLLPSGYLAFALACVGILLMLVGQ
jgi:drug/metabolite transporter (DMT)-like permease